MFISVVTLFPELYTTFLDASLIGRARAHDLLKIEVSSILAFKGSKQRIDAPTYGHGAGMLIKPDVIERAVEHTEVAHGPAYKIFFSPQGQLLDQDVLKELYQALCMHKHLMLLPARYEGIDARAEDYYADKTLSVGNLVLMGGDLPAMMLIEGLARLIPGVVGDAHSVEHDSFTRALVDYPEYTEPIVWKGKAVPEVVRSGNHKALETWRQETAIEKSLTHHFEWLKSHPVTKTEKKLALERIPPHYVALMHTEVMVPNNQGCVQGQTSVTSLDIHDVARSACTYGLQEYFLVTPLIDQQKIIMTLLDFWMSPEGTAYNKQRQEAVSKVKIASTLQEVIDAIQKQEGKEPVVIGTSAREEEYCKHSNPITYYDQSAVFCKQQPVLFILGTGHGLAPSLLERCTFMLPPIQGFTDFNHLSVRSAAAVIFDRWLGNNIKTFYSASRKACYEN